MKVRHTTRILMGAALSCTSLVAQARTNPAPAKLYNTAQQKLLEGKQVFRFTQSRMDIDRYCESAKHYDYAWFEMQHSTLEFKEVEAMIGACQHAGAIPTIRFPDAREWHVQHATDIGALGVIIPTVDDPEGALEAVKWSRFPPDARRSSGGGQVERIWGVNGVNYRQTVNDNMLVKPPLGSRTPTTSRACRESVW